MQFSKRRIFLFLDYRTIENVQKPSNPGRIACTSNAVTELCRLSILLTFVVSDVMHFVRTGQAALLLGRVQQLAMTVKI
jgi:hypothetical protein